MNDYTADLIEHLQKALDNAVGDDFRFEWTEMCEYRIREDDYEERPQTHALLLCRSDIEMIVSALKSTGGES